MATPTIREHTDAVIAALEAEGLTVGNASGDGLEPPYVVVYRIGGIRDGEASAPEDRAELVYQLTCVGAMAEAAEYLQDRAESAMRSLTVPGRAVRTWIDSDGPVMRDDDLSPPLWYATPRWRVWSTPS